MRTIPTPPRTTCRECGAVLAADHVDADLCSPCDGGERGDLPPATLTDDPFELIVEGTKEWNWNAVEAEKQRQMARPKALPAPMCKCERPTPVHDVDGGEVCLTCGKAC